MRNQHRFSLPSCRQPPPLFKHQCCERCRPATQCYCRLPSHLTSSGSVPDDTRRPSHRQTRNSAEHFLHRHNLRSPSPHRRDHDPSRCPDAFRAAASGSHAYAGEGLQRQQLHVAVWRRSVPDDLSTALSVGHYSNWIRLNSTASAEETTDSA